MKTVFKSKLAAIALIASFLFACKSNTAANTDDHMIESDTTAVISGTNKNASDTITSGTDSNSGTQQNDPIVDTTKTSNK